MTVDIIIPAYNAQETIDRALASIATQKLDAGDSYRVTIVNDCSPDGDYHDCACFWAHFMDIQTIDKPVNQGCGQARQTGVDYTDGDFFVFLDADDCLGSPVAIRSLLDAIKQGYDVVMGMFVEETEDKQFFNHGANWVWCHGKMYRRSFINEHNIRFNETRGNEDVGYHSVIHAITENAYYIPQVVYIWQNQHNSLVRNSRDGYAYDYGWRDFIENMAWAVEEMQKRDIDEQTIIDFVAMVIARLYWQTEEAHEHFPESDEINLDKLREFYSRAAEGYVTTGKIPYEMLAAAYVKLTAESDYSVIPHKTFDTYLQEIGFKEGEKS